MNFVAFNKNADKVLAYFRLGYMFGKAEFEKTEEEWVMISSAITGIEK